MFPGAETAAREADDPEKSRRISGQRGTAGIKYTV